MKLIFMTLISFAYLHAIITIAPEELGAKPGFSGSLEGSLETKRGNTESDAYSMGVKFQYDDNASYLIWSALSGSYAKVAGEKNTDKTYAHVRLIHSLYKSADWESFVQSETNAFTKVKYRRLLGAGLRVHLLDKEMGKIYAGLGAYYEDISYTTTLDPNERNARVNFYVAYVKQFQNNNKLAYTAYYQPKINAFDDYITSHSIELEVTIYQKLYLKFNLSYNRDSMPAVDVNRIDFAQKTSFVYKF